MRIALLSNPSSGRGRHAAADDVARRILTDAGHEVLHVRGSSYEQARDAGRALLGDGPHRNVEALVVVGGDGMVRHWSLSAGTAWSTWGWMSSRRRACLWASWPPVPVMTSPGTSVCPAGTRRPPPASSTRRCPERAPSRRWTRSTPPAPTALCSPRSVAGPWPWSAPEWTQPSTPAPTPSPGPPARDATYARGASAPAGGGQHPLRRRRHGPGSPGRPH